jgi:lysosomal alpha-mannosidase
MVKSSLLVAGKLFKKGIIRVYHRWVQPDEAATHYIDLIDQYTLGFDKLSKNFGDCGITKVAWQVINRTLFINF